MLHAGARRTSARNPTCTSVSPRAAPGNTLQTAAAGPLRLAYAAMHLEEVGDAQELQADGRVLAVGVGEDELGQRDAGQHLPQRLIAPQQLPVGQPVVHERVPVVLVDDIVVRLAARASVVSTRRSAACGYVRAGICVNDVNVCLAARASPLSTKCLHTLPVVHDTSQI